MINGFRGIVLEMTTLLNVRFVEYSLGGSLYVHKAFNIKEKMQNSLTWTSVRLMAISKKIATVSGRKLLGLPT